MNEVRRLVSVGTVNNLICSIANQSGILMSARQATSFLWRHPKLARKLESDGVSWRNEASIFFALGEEVVGAEFIPPTLCLPPVEASAMHKAFVKAARKAGYQFVDEEIGEGR